MAQTRQPLGARMTFQHRAASFHRQRRRRRRRITVSNTILCVWALLTMLVWSTHAQPIFSNLYEGFMGSTTATKICLDRCLDCEHWNKCWWGSHTIPIWRSVVYAERLWEGLLAFCTTLEVLVRGFTLGFGLRMLKYLFWEEAFSSTSSSGSLLQSHRNKVLISAIAGLSLATFLFGSSLFVPAEVREEWFDHHNHRHNHACVYYQQQPSPPETNVPQALYQYIRKKMVQEYKNDDGTMECRAHCEGETCENPLVTIDIDFWSYFLERARTGLSHLTNTLEVLLRGFSLGFGARMLQFLFWNGDDLSNSENESIDSRLWKSFRHRALVSVLAGFASSAFVHGFSLFVPAFVRDQWFVHGIDTYDVVEVLAHISFWGSLLLSIWFVLGRCCGVGRKKNKQQ